MALTGHISVSPTSRLRAYDHGTPHGSYRVTGIEIDGELDLAIGPGFMGDAAVVAACDHLIAALQDVRGKASLRVAAEAVA